FPIAIQITDGYSLVRIAWEGIGHSRFEVPRAVVDEYRNAARRSRFVIDIGDGHVRVAVAIEIAHDQITGVYVGYIRCDCRPGNESAIPFSVEDLQLSSAGVRGRDIRVAIF